MLIWIDLANSPHVPFFRALIPEFERRGHTVLVTARRFAQTIELAEVADIKHDVIGGHGGAGLARKAGNLIGRTISFVRWARGRGIDLAVSHNSYAQTAAARALGIKSVTLMDYEYQPANHLAFRLANRVIVPLAFPDEALRRYGTSFKKVRRYNGTKEDVYLADFVPDPDFRKVLSEMGIGADHIIVVVRPPANEALYHRFENELFDELIDKLCSHPDVKIILLARSESQRVAYSSRNYANMIIPSDALDGANLIAHADLVISAGGTMNREAAALGVPAATIYAGKWAAVDEELVRDGRLQRLKTQADLGNLSVTKRSSTMARGALHVRQEVADLILSG